MADCSSEVVAPAALWCFMLSSHLGDTMSDTGNMLTQELLEGKPIQQEGLRAASLSEPGVQLCAHPCLVPRWSHQAWRELPPVSFSFPSTAIPSLSSGASQVDSMDGVILVPAEIDLKGKGPAWTWSPGGSLKLIFRS